MILVSFYCDVDNNQFFEKNAIRLKKQCQALDMPHHIVPEHYGYSWIDNVRAKPRFLLKMLDHLKDDIFWLDVDCSIHKKIDFKIDVDWICDVKTDGRPHDYVHFIKNNQANRDRIAKWIVEIENLQRGSHTAFALIYKDLHTAPMPTGYVSLGLSKGHSKQEYFRARLD